MDYRTDIDLQNVSVEMFHVLQAAYSEQRPITIRATVIDPTADEGIEPSSSEVTGLIEQLYIGSDRQFYTARVTLWCQR
jgi:hypothetical protein